MTGREQPRLLQGAHITLGPVALQKEGADGKPVGKDFIEFSDWEIAYIVARFMNQNSKGNIFYGSLRFAIKQLWGDEISVTDYKLRRISQRLRALGLSSGLDNNGSHYWRINNLDIESAYKREVIKTPEPQKVTYRCAFCQAKFDENGALKAHIESQHPLDRKEEVVSDTQVIAETQRRSIKEVAAEAAEKDYSCPICGKTMNFRGLGGHMNGHKLSPHMRELLDAVSQAEGQHPREYAILLNKTSSSVSQVASQLVKRGLLKTTGSRASVRYFTSDHKIEKTEESAKKEKPFTPRRKENPNGNSDKAKMPDASPNLVEGLAPGLRPAYILNTNGKEFLIDGDNVIPLP